MKKPSPPRLAVWLLERIVAEPDREYVLGDLHRFFADRTAQGVSPLVLRLRYWREVVAAIGPSVRRRRELARQKPRSPLRRKEQHVDNLIRDVRHALRVMRRNPGFTVIAALTLALGIGANTAIFSVLHNTLLKPLPYAEAEGIAALTVEWSEEGSGRSRSTGHGLSEPELMDFRRSVASFEEIGAYWFSPANVTGEFEPERVQAGVASPEVFSVLGASALFGRTFNEEDGRPESNEVALLSHAYWSRRYGNDRDVLGRDIILNGRPRTIVGVMPEDFVLPHAYADAARSTLWVPLRLDPANLNGRGSHYLNTVARLGDGRTMEQAASELVAVGGALTEAGHYEPEADFAGGLIPVYDLILGGVRPVLIVLMAAVGFLLLVACANVANLLLARAEGRRRELTLRAAIGASRGALVRQMLTEGVMLGLVGGVVGVGLAAVALNILTAMQPPSIPRIDEISLTSTVVWYAIGLSLVTSVLFGSVPAFLASRGEIQPGLKETGNMSAGTSRHFFQRSLVAVQMAFAVLLVIGAGLTVRSFSALLAIDPGFRAERVLSAQVALPFASYGSSEEIVGFYNAIVRDAAELPGVESVGAARVLPLAQRIGDWSISIEGRVARPGEDFDGDWQIVTPGYFETMQITLLEGRLIEPIDLPDAPPVMVVNQTMADRYWPGESAIGKRVRLGTSMERPWISIVGVVGDVRHNGISDPVTPKWYIPHAQFGEVGGSARAAMTFVLRTQAAPQTVAGGLRGLIHARDPQLPVSAIQTMDEVLDASVGQERFTMSLLLSFGLVALGLAMIGVYGVQSFVVSNRTREFGLRMALGATPKAVVLMVVRQGMVLAVVGLGIGVLAAVWLTRPLETMLFSVGVRDLATFTIAPIGLAVVAVLATLVPARRAVSVDPVRALRQD